MLKAILDLYRKIFSKQKKALNVSCKTEAEESKDISVDEILSFAEESSEILVTVTGINHYYGRMPFESGKKVFLIKEPGNAFDPYAISVICEDVGKCGYIANNDYTVKDGTASARLLCGAFSEKCLAEVMWVDEKFVVCRLVGIDSQKLAYNYGVYFYKNGKIQSALDIFERLCKKREDITIYHILCNCCIELGYEQKAKLYLEKALSLDGDNSTSAFLENKIKNLY